MVSGPEAVQTARVIATKILDATLLPHHRGKADFGPHAGDWAYEWVRDMRDRISAEVIDAWLCGHGGMPLGSVLKEVSAS